MLLVSCGANTLNKETATNALALTSVNGVNGKVCTCASEYMPVCAADGPNMGTSYENVCIASCMGATQTTQGHCLCSSSLQVCVENTTTMDECSAIGLGKKITKFISCEKTPL